MDKADDANTLVKGDFIEYKVGDGFIKSTKITHNFINSDVIAILALAGGIILTSADSGLKLLAALTQIVLALAQSNTEEPPASAGGSFLTRLCSYPGQVDILDVDRGPGTVRPVGPDGREGRAGGGKLHRKRSRNARDHRRPQDQGYFDRDHQGRALVCSLGQPATARGSLRTLASLLEGGGAAAGGDGGSANQVGSPSSVSVQGLFREFS